MRKAILILLAFALVNFTPYGQTRPAAAPTVNKDYERMAAQVEEIAMCHHAIKAAQHDALAFDQNPYYRYIINSPRKGSDENVYPIPERCKSLATDWILSYTKMSDKDKADLDKSISGQIGMTIPEMATDVQFLNIVINKMLIEGDKAIMWSNEDKDIPPNP